MNKDINKNIETIFFLTDKNLAHISSTIVRDTLRNGGDISNFVPEEINYNYLFKKSTNFLTALPLWLISTFLLLVISADLFMS